MITFNEQTKTFYLETEKTSYVMRVLENGTLYHSYYGKKIAQDDMTFYSLLRTPNFAAALQVGRRTFSYDVLSQEYPTKGRGDHRAPAVLIENEQGRTVNELKYKSHRIIDGKKEFGILPQLNCSDDSCKTLEITLTDAVNGFDAVLSYSVFHKENVIARRTEIVNTSGKTLKIRKASSFCFDIDDKDFEMVTLEGAWARERHIERYPLHHGTSSVESRRGASSHQLNPFVALVRKNTDEDCGEVYAASLVYSGDFKMQAEVDHYGRTRFEGGINPETFTWKLLAGESFVTPEALLVYSAEGLNGMSKAFHRVCRGYLGKCSENIKHPIVINSWEAMYFDISDEKFYKFIEGCKGLGIDTVVMDDGWFGHRTDDKSSLGDWFVDKSRFPDGLTNIINCCKENGMKFGIWFEPEMISPDSELYRAHPDWCIHADGFAPVTARSQLVLDLSRKEICDAIYEQLAAVLSENDISYVKWDMNRHITDNGSNSLGADRQGEHAHRYILGVYYLMDKITKAFPNVFFEGCSGGGGRFDFGMLYYMPQIWTSDDSDAVERLKIQYGTSLVYPQSAIVAHVSDCPNHQTGRTTPFETRGNVAQLFSLGYEFDAGKLSDDERNAIAEQISKHRELESLVETGDFYRLISPFEGNTCAWELVSDDQNTAYAVFVRVLSVPEYQPQYLRLRGLDENKTYRVEPLGVTAKGSTLMNAGIPVFIGNSKDFASLIFDIKAV